MPDLKDAMELVTGWVKARRNDKGWQSDALTCADGFKFSVQANQYCYCLSRINDADVYQAFECGFPSSAEPLLTGYTEEPERPTQTVYGWAPASVIAAVVEKHGGLV